ncbi:MAG: YceD family protein [Acidimicrobiales bacterium]
MGKSAFQVTVADLLHRPGARRHEQITGTLEPLRVVDTTVAGDAPVTVDVTLEWVSEGILATGTVAAPFAASCRRCLTDVHGDVEAKFQELFEPNARDGESYPLHGDRMDLGPLAREVLLLGLPLAPLCLEACQGLCPTCGADLNQGPCDCQPADIDPRWAALEGLLVDPPPDPPEEPSGNG